MNAKLERNPDMAFVADRGRPPDQPWAGFLW